MCKQACLFQSVYRESPKGNETRGEWKPGTRGRSCKGRALPGLFQKVFGLQGKGYVSMDRRGNLSYFRLARGASGNFSTAICILQEHTCTTMISRTSKTFKIRLNVFISYPVLENTLSIFLFFVELFDFCRR